MRHQFSLALILLLTSFSCLAQIKFKKGYYIDKEDNKIECYIKDVQSKYAPKSFTYRRTEDGFNETMSTDAIKEFVAGDSRYIRIHTRYDQSTQDIRKMNSFSNPDWVEADILLRQVVGGKASLYEYSTSNYLLFFFSVDDGPIEQLVFKQYNPPGDYSVLLANNLYLAQLNQKVKCPSQATLTDRQVQYNEPSLTQQFTAFNACNGEVAVKKDKKKVVSLSITPGYDFSTAKAITEPTPLDFGTSKSFRIGAEFQLVLPFNHNKWEIMVEPAYSSYSGKTSRNVKLEIQTFYLPIGIRHRFFLSEKSSIFLNVAAFPEVALKHDQGISANSPKVVESKSMAFGSLVGAGYSFGHFSLEARYSPKWQRNEDIYGYDYTRASVILGFRIF